MSWGLGALNAISLLKTATQAANELGIEFELEKVSDFDKIMSFGVMMTPGLVIGGEVKSVGRIPSLSEIRDMLK